MSTPSDRARRRADWTGEVVPLGAPKRGMYASLTPEQRLAALAALNERAWRASGRAMPDPLPRAQWPGEVFEIVRRG